LDGLDVTVFERVWRFRAAADREREFQELYGPSGAWAQLFASAPGYLGTELQRSEGNPREFLTIDRWESRAAWERFRRDHAAAYEDLDRLCEPLTTFEELVGEFDPPVRPQL
jgi:heme-degrading monooxygenase HmoA